MRDIQLDEGRFLIVITNDPDHHALDLKMPLQQLQKHALFTLLWLIGTHKQGLFNEEDAENKDILVISTA